MKWCLIQSPSLRMVTIWQLCQDQRGHHILIGSKARNTKDVYIPWIFLHIPANHAYLCIFLQTFANLIISYLNSFFGPGRIALKTQFDSPTSPVGHIGGLLCPPSATWEQVDQGKTCRGVVICWPATPATPKLSVYTCAIYNSVSHMWLSAQDAIHKWNIMKPSTRDRKSVV